MCLGFQHYIMENLTKNINILYTHPNQVELVTASITEFDKVGTGAGKNATLVNLD